MKDARHFSEKARNDFDWDESVNRTLMPIDRAWDMPPSGGRQVRDVTFTYGHHRDCDCLRASMLFLEDLG